MAIQVHCSCGRAIKVRDNAAGKRVRCPDCQKPVRVPEPQLDEVEEVFDDGADSYGDDDYGYGSDDYAPAQPPRRSAAKRRRSSGSAGKAKRKKSAGSGVPTALIIVAAVVVGSVAIGGGLYLAMGGGGDDPVIADNNAAGEPGEAAGSAGANAAATNSAVPTGGGTNATAQQAGAGNGAAANQNSTNGSPSSTPSNSANANAANANAANAAGSGATAGAGGADRLWVQLSEFKPRSGSGNAIGRSYQISYKVVSGQAAPNKNYVLFVATDLGVMQRYIEVDVIPQGSGSIPFDVGIGMSGNLKAYMALKTGRQDWKPVSGEIKINGEPTTAQRPPTIQEAAGADAQGKMLALANPRFERGRIGRNALVVDFVLQQPYEPGKNYFLIIEGNSGQPVVSRASPSLMRMKVGDSDQMGVSLMGPGNFPDGPLRIYVEIRQGMRSKDGAERVSNVVTLNR